MTIEHNGLKYKTTLESVHFDFSIKVNSLEEACAIVNDMAKMNAYKFGEVEYTDMVVTKRTIIADENGITVKIVLREKTEAEKVREELADVLIYAFLMGNDLGLDISEIVSNKIDENNRKYPVEKAKGNSLKYDEL